MEYFNKMNIISYCYNLLKYNTLHLIYNIMNVCT